MHGPEFSYGPCLSSCGTACLSVHVMYVFTTSLCDRDPHCPRDYPQVVDRLTTAIKAVQPSATIETLSMRTWDIRGDAAVKPVALETEISDDFQAIEQKYAL